MDLVRITNGIDDQHGGCRLAETFDSALGYVSRLGIDFILLFLFLRWIWKKKKRRKKYLNRRTLFRVALLLIAVYFVIPNLLGAISPQARYFSQYVEAHKLRAYYMLWALIPGRTATYEQINQMITSIAFKYGVDAALVRSVVKVEANYDQYALSKTGACGLMQLMPATYFSLQGGNPFGAKSNLTAGVKYLRNLMRKYQGNLRLALAAYNSGPTNVDRYGDVPPFPETRRYVKKVLIAYNLDKGPS